MLVGIKPDFFNEFGGRKSILTGTELFEFWELKGGEGGLVAPTNDRDFSIFPEENAQLEFTLIIAEVILSKKNF